ncbi:MAG: DHH family phosphoesterase [Methylococcales bacterium]
MNYDIFNGDADGICALIQLRLADPKPSQLITGVKRDIQLVQKVEAKANDCLTILDISLAKNITAVQSLLNQGTHILYIDHHQTGEVPTHPHLKTLLNTDANVCTSLIANQYLQGQFQLWAIVGAFGDNLLSSAFAAAKNLNLREAQLTQLQQLGTYINYNAYGTDLSDLHIAPDQLFKQLLPYHSPFDFIEDNTALFTQLQTAYNSDLAEAEKITPEFTNEEVCIICLPDQAWARRVSGVYSNLLANQNPQRTHAILSPISPEAYQVSVRAALNNKQGADKFCAQFATGGGRAAAAGINELPKTQLANFITGMKKFF